MWKLSSSSNTPLSLNPASLSKLLSGALPFSTLGGKLCCCIAFAWEVVCDLADLFFLLGLDSIELLELCFLQSHWGVVVLALPVPMIASVIYYDA
jgi:hypothetical protein